MYLQGQLLVAGLRNVLRSTVFASCSLAALPGCRCVCRRASRLLLRRSLSLLPGCSMHSQAPLLNQQRRRRRSPCSGTGAAANAPLRTNSSSSTRMATHRLWRQLLAGRREGCSRWTRLRMTRKMQQQDQHVLLASLQLLALQLQLLQTPGWARLSSTDLVFCGRWRCVVAAAAGLAAAMVGTGCPSGDCCWKAETTAF